MLSGAAPGHDLHTARVPGRPAVLNALFDSLQQRACQLLAKHSTSFRLNGRLFTILPCTVTDMIGCE